jgi:hypothetical protein
MKTEHVPFLALRSPDLRSLTNRYQRI